MLRSIKPSTIKNGMEAAVGDRIRADRIKLEAGKDRDVEPLEHEEVVTRSKAIQSEVVTGVLHLTMAHQDQLHKHPLFR